MSFNAFGKNSGPSGPPRAQPPFGHFARAPSPTPPFSASPLQRSIRELEASGRTYSPPLAFQGHRSDTGSYSYTQVLRPIVPPHNAGPGQRSSFSNYYAGTQQRPSVMTAVTPVLGSQDSGAYHPAKIAPPQDLKRSRSPQSLYTEEDSVRSSRRGSVVPSDFLFDNHRQSVTRMTRPPSAFSEKHNSIENFGPFVQRPAVSSPVWVTQAGLPGNFSNSWTRQDNTAVSPHDSQRTFAANPVGAQVPRTRSPPLRSANEYPEERSHFSQNDSKRPSPSPPGLNSRSNNLSKSSDSEIPHISQPSAQSFDNKAATTNSANISVPKRTRSPPLPFTDQVFQGHPSAQDGAQSIADKAAATKPVNLPVSKRTRSPPLLSTDQVFQGNSFAQDDNERELLAKAKRAARFKVELSQPEQSTAGIGNQKFTVNTHNQSHTERRKTIGERSSDMERDIPDGNVLSDYEAPESSAIIIGLCPDMCPESEREERERKGDLDQYERLDGDRNRSSKSLAVKKYNRTAEREADLIRPMPILQKTIEYLLYLLEQPYDEKFLGLYNFLWDRMRAIRMDLRMQHIFNLDAIAMLEQMIRLHIIAMHELCEHTKGEGFSEGFDAHLNIEQMNKTSVELFQLYDDHRKKGTHVPTEKEFRGYYALLKLDKHPGYKVEPAELSLELSKMTPAIRQTPEVLFARDVARACRTGNFIAFFRLAKKASYLQGCLMHAHFAKLRTQALASLHCGLQNNQGIPVSHVAKWLAMEEEDIESLLEYYGFSIKEYEEPYMVKEGPFLNSDDDYPVKCSKLVHMKKSQTIFEDVSSPQPAASLPAEIKKGQFVKVYNQEPKPVKIVVTGSPVQASDEEMSDLEASPSPKDGTQVKPMVKALPISPPPIAISPPTFVVGPPTLAIGQPGGVSNQKTAVGSFSWDFSVVHSSPKSQLPRVESIKKSNSDAIFRSSLEKTSHADPKPISYQVISGEVDKEKFASSGFDSAVEGSVPKKLPFEEVEYEERTDSHQDVQIEEVEPSYHDEEVAAAKLKLILRIWKRRSLKKRELRDQRQLVAMAALDSLSLGLPIRWRTEQLSTSGEFNVDRIMNERYQRHERSWSRLNVSDVIAGTLSRKNPAAKCLCWKIILCSQMDNPDSGKLREWNQVAHLNAGPWLLSKLMPPRKDEDGGLISSSPGLSIWKKWVPSQSGGDYTCCLSVVRDCKLSNMRDSVLGASAVLFLVSKSISLETQKFQLHNLVMSLPPGSSLPLLILVDFGEENSESSSIVAEKLGLHDIDRSRINNFSVVFLVETQQLEKLDGFFSNEQLRRGLQWLASESQSESVVSCIKTRELVLAHLGSSLEVLNEKSPCELGPDDCISAFNEALHQAAGKIAAAGNANPAFWPCPEMASLENTSNEYDLPEIGWSSSARIELLIRGLTNCELPSFQDDISWLSRGSSVCRDIENQKLELEKCLIRYLSQSSKIMGLSLATNEAHVMLQKCARLELHNSTYYIVPKWVMIFRRVFNWRLMSLSDGSYSTAYVLEQDVPAISTSCLDKLGFEGSLNSAYYLSPPSLDEMIEVGCSTFAPSNDYIEDGVAFQQPPSVVVSHGGEATQATSAGNMREEDVNLAVQEGDLASLMNNDSYLARSSNDSKAMKEAENLGKLFEQCNILQDMIDKKLSIYF